MRFEINLPKINFCAEPAKKFSLCCQIKNSPFFWGGGLFDFFFLKDKKIERRMKTNSYQEEEVRVAIHRLLTAITGSADMSLIGYILVLLRHNKSYEVGFLLIGILCS